MLYPQATNFRLCRPADLPAVYAFLNREQEPLSIPQKQELALTIKSFWEHGGILCGYRQGELLLAFGFCLGEVSLGYQNTEVASVHLLALNGQDTDTDVFFTGLRELTCILMAKGVYEMRFYAAVGERWLGRLYACLARTLGYAPDRQGVDRVIYACSTERALTLTGRLAQPADRGGKATRSTAKRLAVRFNWLWAVA